MEGMSWLLCTSSTPSTRSSIFSGNDHFRLRFGQAVDEAVAGSARTSSQTIRFPYSALRHQPLPSWRIERGGGFFPPPLRERRRWSEAKHWELASSVK